MRLLAIFKDRRTRADVEFWASDLPGEENLVYVVHRKRRSLRPARIAYVQARRAALLARRCGWKRYR